MFKTWCLKHRHPCFGISNYLLAIIINLLSFVDYCRVILSTVNKVSVKTVNNCKYEVWRSTIVQNFIMLVHTIGSSNKKARDSRLRCFERQHQRPATSPRIICAADNDGCLRYFLICVCSPWAKPNQSLWRLSLVQQLRSVPISHFTFADSITRTLDANVIEYS